MVRKITLKRGDSVNIVINGQYGFVSVKHKGM